MPSNFIRYQVILLLAKYCPNLLCRQTSDIQVVIVQYMRRGLEALKQRRYTEGKWCYSFVQLFAGPSRPPSWSGLSCKLYWPHQWWLATLLHRFGRKNGQNQTSSSDSIYTSLREFRLLNVTNQCSPANLLLCCFVDKRAVHYMTPNEWRLLHDLQT